MKTKSKKQKIQKCEACGGTGILLNQHGKIERCDTCEKYSNDHSAWNAASPKEQ